MRRIKVPQRTIAERLQAQIKKIMQKFGVYKRMKTRVGG
jgi:hypothetical protein